MTHGGNIFEIQRNCNIDKNQLLDYSANINPLGIPETFKKIIVETLEDIQHYPDIYYEELKLAIEAYYGIDKNHIYLGNGAAEIISNSIRAINPKKSIILAPTFSEYANALRAVGSDIVEFLLKEEEEFKLNTEELIKKIDYSTDLVVLCNPNNPTSKLVHSEDVIKLLEKCINTDTYLMIDEAFMDFIKDNVKYSMLYHYKKYRNLVIVRAFTKFYSIPGIRLGFGVSCDGGFIERINDLALPWSLNTFASYFGRVLLNEEEYVKNTYEWMDYEKQRFVNQLKKIEGIKVFNPSANFILIKILKSSIDVRQLKIKMLDKNILIRDCSNFNNLNEKFFRIAIKNKLSNNQLLQILKKVI